MTLTLGLQIGMWLIGTGITLLVIWFGFVTDVKSRLKDHESKISQHKEDIEKLDKLESRIVGVEKEQEIFMHVISPHLSKIIHSPNHKRRDMLVDKLVNGNITAEELCELKLQLNDLAETTTDNGHRFAAAILLARVEILITREKTALRQGDHQHV